MKLLVNLLGAVVLLQSASCVRFIPSRHDLNRPYGDDPSIEYVGIDAFYLYDREQRSRLEQLIGDRIAKSETAWDAAYKIGPGDRIQIEVKNFEEVSKSYQVQPNGTINLPFVGKLAVEGKTEEDLAGMIRGKVQDYVLEPQVFVEVTDYSAHKVWIVGGSGDFSASSGNKGEIRDGGSSISRQAFPLRRQNYSLVELLVEIGEGRLLSSMGTIYLYPEGGLHGGILDRKEKITKLRRTTLQDVSPFCDNNKSGWMKTEGRPKETPRSGFSKFNTNDGAACQGYDERMASTPLDVKYHPNARIQIDVEELFGGATHPPLYVPLRPGDAIYIPTTGLIQVYGEVNNKGTFSVANSGSSASGTGAGGVKPTLFSVLAAANGLNYAADIHNIEIYRELEFGKKVVLNVDFQDLTLRGTQDVRLRDGDIVWVPSQAGRFTEQHSIDALNSILGAGNNVYNTATQE